MDAIWLLDIDGVINADPFKIPTHVWPEDQWRIHMVPDHRGKQWRITAAQPVIDFINEVHSGNWAEIIWLTTWQGDANNVSDALGLPHFQHLANPMEKTTRYAGPKWWKLAEANKIRTEGRAIVWTDDDISIQIRTLFQHDQPTLLLSPKGSEGLAEVHLERIAKFLVQGTISDAVKEVMARADSR